MKPPRSESVTEMLLALNEGDPTVYERLLPVIYSELHKIAGHFMRLERRNHTLQPTALINEAYLRLVNESHPSWQNRQHFFGAAANVMRRALVDHARKRNADKRGARLRVTVEEDVLQSLPDNHMLLTRTNAEMDILDLNVALEKLGKLDPETEKIVELRFFSGLTEEEVAELMDISLRTVKRRWGFAKSWLYREMSGELPE